MTFTGSSISPENVGTNIRKTMNYKDYAAWPTIDLYLGR